MSHAPEEGPPRQGFSLELGEDLARTREWLHEFAVSVIRPAAAEWDEREETPWPVHQEAAKIGLYSLDFYAQQYTEPSGLGIPVAFMRFLVMVTCSGYVPGQT
jgi:alkylation response protein AidB-like acyl-CoA dehydrogenase